MFGFRRFLPLFAGVILGLFVILVAAAGPAGAQPSARAPLDYPAWQEAADSARDEIEDAQALSNEELDALRQELVEWRQGFEAAQSTNSTAIASVQAQIETLGPVPESGEEAPDIAAQRADLESRLAELRKPRREAELAYSEATSLISAIDTMMRDRQTDRLLELGPSPLNPVNWPGTMQALGQLVMGAGSEITTNWQNPSVRTNMRANLPLILILLGVASVLITRGRAWTERLTTNVQERQRTAQHYLLGFLISLGQVILPVGGLVALAAAFALSGLPGERSGALAQVLPYAGFGFFGAIWIGSRVFPHSNVNDPPLDLDATQRLEGRIQTALLGVVLFIFTLIDVAGKTEAWSSETLNTVLFPVIVLSGLMLLRVARLLGSHALSLDAADPGTEGGPSEITFRRRLIYWMSRVLVVLAIVGPVLAGVGYFQAGSAIVFPTVASLLLMGVLIILQRVLTELYILLTRNREGAATALWPVLAGFTLTVISLPVFALIWGARVTDLTELWARFRAGFMMGETRISPSDFLTFLLVFLFGLMVTRLIQGAMRTTVLPRTRLDIGGQNAIVSGLGYIGIFLAVIISVTTAGIDLSSLALVASALTVGIGFGLQTVVSNFVSGIILLIERPISEGDWIEVGGNMGFVRSISVRSTRIETFDRTDVIVPNADLVSGTVTNWTRGNLVGRMIVPVGVAYGTDTRRVSDILLEIAEAQPLVLLKPPPYVYFLGFGADSLNFEIRAILRDINQLIGVVTEVNHQIVERFQAEGIEIPFAQRDIWLRNPEALRGTAPPPAPSGPSEHRDAQGTTQDPRGITQDTRGAAAGQLDAGDLDTGQNPDADGDGR